MDYFQYKQGKKIIKAGDEVLNLIINGLLSIYKKLIYISINFLLSFKPYYKWITFNI